MKLLAISCAIFGAAVMSFATDDAMIAALNRAATATDPRVRAAAARALGDFASPAARESLHALVQDKNEIVSIAAIEALTRSEDKSTTKMLVDLLKLEATTVGSTNSSPVFNNSGTLLQQFVEMKSEERTVATIRLLGRTKDPTVVPVIITSGLKSPHIGAQIAAAIALGRLKDKAGAQPLMEMLELYYPSGESNGPLIDRGPVPPEIQRLKENYAYLRTAVVWALGEIRERNAQSVLQRATEDDNSLVRDAAKEALEKLKDY